MGKCYETEPQIKLILNPLLSYESIDELASNHIKRYDSLWINNRNIIHKHDTREINSINFT